MESIQYQPSGLELLSSLSEKGQQEFYRSLSPSEQAQINHDWRGFIARPNQLPPGTPGASNPRKDWTYWMAMAGRGWGKTRVGAETVREWALQKLEAPIHLVAPTAGDIRKVMVEGPSGLLKCYSSGMAPKYEPSKGHLITWENGNTALCFSADEPERLRGPQCCRFWCDEIAAWRFAEDAWDNLIFGFRIGSNLRGIITSTPKPIAIVKNIVNDPHTVVTRASSYENRKNLAAQFFDTIIRKYEGTRLGRQELLAELLEDIPGALWTQSLIDAGKIKYKTIPTDYIIRVVVAIDPAVTVGEKSADTGIVVAALLRNGDVLVLDDQTCHESPAGWARTAIAAFRANRADRIIGEINNGGDLVEATIRAVDANVPYRAVRAKRGKAIRAEPVAALYEQGRVCHMRSFPELETQMTQFVPGQEDDSERLDRMDALVWAITELVIDVEQVQTTRSMAQVVRISPY